MRTIVSPSLLSADFSNLQKDIAMINQSEAEWLHLDIMDGVFVPNISFGFSVINAVEKICTKTLDAHFMIIHPEQYITRAAKNGITNMTVHIETCTRIRETIRDIHNAGMKAGVAINPMTPITMLEDALDIADLFTVMTVNPGFGGQKFNEQCYDKVRQLRRMIDESGSKALIEVDGGINETTAPLVVQAGANVLVSGNYVFKSENPLEIIRSLKALG